MATLFISDLHLDPGRPDIIEHFLAFLERDAAGADALYILGDLFEAWIGDDDDSPLAASVCDALNSCAGTGVPVSGATTSEEGPGGRPSRRYMPFSSIGLVTNART